MSPNQPFHRAHRAALARAFTGLSTLAVVLAASTLLLAQAATVGAVSADGLAPMSVSLVTPTPLSRTLAPSGNLVTGPTPTPTPRSLSLAVTPLSGTFALPPSGPAPLPDLVVSRTMDVSPKYCALGICLPYPNEVALTTTVTNRGTGPSAPTEVDVNGSRRGIPALAPGVVVRVHWPVQDCDFFMITVDPDNVVQESNEGNNWLQAECA